MRPRHCGLDPQSRSEVAGLTTRQTDQPIPLSLDGRGIKGEGESKTVGVARRTVILALRQYPQGEAPDAR